MRIEVKTENEDKTLNVYIFTISDTTAVFTEFNKQFKPEGKKVWKITALWDKYNERESKIEEPELTDEVRELAFNEMVRRIKIKTWKEYQRND